MVRKTYAEYRAEKRYIHSEAGYLMCEEWYERLDCGRKVFRVLNGNWRFHFRGGFMVLESEYNSNSWRRIRSPKDWKRVSLDDMTAEYAESYYVKVLSEKEFDNWMAFLDNAEDGIAF